MLSTSIWRLLRYSLLVGTCAVAWAPLVGLAQQPGQLTPQTFQANPSQVLADFPNGGPLMISLIRQLAIADHADLALIIDLLATANVDQANAVGTGLGQAALASVTDQAYAYKIQASLAAVNNQTASLAYAAVMGDQGIGATGAGGGGGGGGGGPVNQSAVGGGGGSSTPTLSASTPTTSPNLTNLNSSTPGNAPSGPLSPR